MDKVSDDLKLYPDESFNHFTETCETHINFDNDVNDDILNHVNSKYYNILNFHHHSFNVSVPLKVGRTAPMFVPLHSVCRICP